MFLWWHVPHAPPVVAVAREPVQVMLFHSFFENEQPVFLVILLRHIRIRMVFVEELDGVEAAPVDVEVDVATVEVRVSGFSWLAVWLIKNKEWPACT